VIGQLERLLALSRDDLPLEKLRKLEEALAQYVFPLPEMVPLFASLLSIPLPTRYPPLTLTPQRQRQKTLEALLAWLLAEATRHPVLFIVEDLTGATPPPWSSSVSSLSTSLRLASVSCAHTVPSFSLRGCPAHT